MRFIFLFIAFVFSLHCQSQNIGVNITLPEFNLDIRSISGSIMGPDLQLATPTKDHFLRLFGGRPGDPKPFLLYNENDVFRIATSTPPGFTNWKERMTFIAAGYLGIMQPLPTATLDINGVVSNGTSTSSLKIENQSDGNLMLIDANDIDGILDTLHIQRLSPKEMTIAQGGGNIGFNTDARKKIKVTMKGFPIDSQGNPDDPDATLMLESEDFFTPKTRMVLDGTSISTLDKDLYLNHSTDKNIIIGLGGGSVGIGTNSLASSALGYRLSVQGKIISEGYRCQLAFAWPDYVFSNEYNLLTIPELEKDIIKTGHLPGLPSAKTVAKEGIALEEIQAKLIEKVEEMTLYIIQMNKKIDKLESENQKLKNKINSKS